MTRMTMKPVKGDVIQCPSFAYARWSDRGNKYPLLLSGSGPHIVNYHIHERNSDGWERERFVPVDLAAHDLSRGQAYFEVIDARMYGGSDPNDRDPYPNGWRVRAARLTEDYQRTKEVIEFYMSGHFNHQLHAPVKVVGMISNGMFWPEADEESGSE